MKIQVTTTPKAVETVNALLAHCISKLKEDKEMQEYFDCKRKKDIKSLESFRKSMLKSFLEE